MDLEGKVAGIIRESEFSMITEIGICAGQVLICLEAHHGRMPIGDLFFKVEASPEIILMTVGWLVRESYVLINNKDSRNVTISLKKGSSELQKGNLP